MTSLHILAVTGRSVDGLVAISCNKWAALSTPYSKAMSLAQDTIPMKHSDILLLAKQICFVWLHLCVGIYIKPIILIIYQLYIA